MVNIRLRHKTVSTIHMEVSDADMRIIYIEHYLGAPYRNPPRWEAVGGTATYGQLSHCYRWIKILNPNELDEIIEEYVQWVKENEYEGYQPDRRDIVGEY